MAAVRLQPVRYCLLQNVYCVWKVLENALFVSWKIPEFSILLARESPGNLRFQFLGLFSIDHCGFSPFCAAGVRHFTGWMPFMSFIRIHKHSILMAIFPGEAGLPCCLLN